MQMSSVLLLRPAAAPAVALPIEWRAKILLVFTRSARGALLIFIRRRIRQQQAFRWALLCLSADSSTLRSRVFR